MVAISALAVALPLYLWPSKTAWAPYDQTFGANPHVKFNVIVNPNDGPGPKVLDPAYVQGVQMLNSHSNIRSYGYVHTQHATRDIGEVIADIDQYSYWHGNYSINIGGIFIDEAPDGTDPLTGKSTMTHDLQYMNQLYTHIKARMPQGHAQVWTNPGTPVDARFYQYADTLTAYETYYSGWADAQSDIPNAYKSKTSIMLLNTDPSMAATLAANLKTLGYHNALVLAPGDDYQTFSNTWAQFAADVNKSA